jgi:probable HAF family extracellular repeat protein
MAGASDSTSGYEAFRWTAAGGMQGLGGPSGGWSNSEASGVSGDGSVIVGSGISASGYEAFRWTSAVVMVGLGNLPGGFIPSGFSVDGSVVVGYEIQYDASLSPHYTALNWTADGGMWTLWMSYSRTASTPPPMGGPGSNLPRP